MKLSETQSRARRRTGSRLIRDVARSRRNFVVRLARDIGKYLRNAPRCAVELASNSVHEKCLELPLSRAATVFLALIAAGVAGADDGNNIPALPAVIGTNEILYTGTSLLVIIAAIVFVGWIYRRAQGMHSRDGEVIHILATQPLGPKERVLLIEVAGKQLLLGMTASQIQTLHVLEQPLVSDRRRSQPSGFADRLRTAIKGVRK